MTSDRSNRALQAIVFDFDGVIANSEPLHLRAFQQALGEAGLFLGSDEYYSQYLGYDDVGVFETLKAIAKAVLTELRRGGSG